MLRAGSLIYAITIALIIAILSSSIILVVFNTVTAVDNNFISEKQITNISSVLNYYLTNDSLQKQSGIVSIDLFQRGCDMVDLERKPWGLFGILKCKAHQGFKIETGIFLIGDKPIKELSALYLAEQNKPLALCGATLVKGKSFIPVCGVKRAYIEGQSFIGDRLIDGNTQISNLTVPELSKDIEISYKVFTGTLSEDSTTDFSSLSQNKKLFNSFSNRTIVLNSKEDIDLDKCELSGNIIVRTSGSVKITSSAVLSGIIVEASSIFIDARCSIQFQGFARDSIIVGEASKLNYPSTLCILDDQRPKMRSKIILGRSTIINGNVINANIHDIADKSVNVHISDGCIINGMLYSKSYISFKGVVNGSLYCIGFILKTPSAVYENHLLNVTINATTLPNYFAGTFIPSDVKRKALIKRLE